MTALGSFLGWLNRARRRWTAWPPVGGLSFGSLRRLEPVSRQFGLDRGTPIDRYYIERFLASNQEGVRGRVLEVGDSVYTRRFGGARVTQSDVVHAEPGNPNATLVADLARGDELPSDAYDCVICTQTLPFIYDVRDAVRTLHRILKPGGTLLATVPGISQISRYDMDRWGDYWRFTTLSTRKLLLDFFPEAALDIRAHGNVLVAVAFLNGLAAEELTAAELDHTDPDYEAVITVRATKPGVARA